MLSLPPSSYYYKSKQPCLSKQKEEADIRGRIEQIACEFIHYGYRRITAQLKREGYLINRKKVLRIMRESSLLCVVKRNKWIKTTDSSHTYPRYPNLIKGLVIRSLNQAWVADITYIRILTTFVYLAVVLDSFSRKVISYAISKSLDNWLTLHALEIAIEARKPASGCIHHSDQGRQYASNEYIDKLKKYNFQISMSRKGNPYDNPKAESFMKTLKYEEVNLWNYRTLADVKKRVPFFIQEVYNKKRLHSSLKYTPPDEFETIIINKEEALQPAQIVTS